MEAVEHRLDDLGIHGAEAQLLDAVPLVAMCWADGELAPEELEELTAFVEEHLERLNRDEGGPRLSRADAARFLQRFLSERPSPALLRELTALIPAVALSSGDPSRDEERRQAILGGCLDVGSAAPTYAPVTRRLSTEEKAWYAEVARLLRGNPQYA